MKAPSMRETRTRLANRAIEKGWARRASAHFGAQGERSQAPTSSTQVGGSEGKAQPREDAGIQSPWSLVLPRSAGHE